MKKVVSSIGTHNGKVKIYKDEYRWGKSNNIPNKSSMSGAHAQIILKNLLVLKIKSCEWMSRKLRTIILEEVLIEEQELKCGRH